MKIRIPPVMIATLTLAFALHVHSQHPMRTWTNADERTLEARMLSASQDNVTVMTATGQTHILVLNTLSDEDQRYVRTNAGGRRGGPVANREAKWLEDFEAAKTEAEALEKPILLLFTGSDWCPPCMRLERTVFKDDAFKEFANENLVLAMADFPRRRQQNRAQKEANEALRQRFEIRGYPTMVLLDEKGELKERFGYGGQEAKDFVTMLEGKMKP